MLETVACTGDFSIYSALCDNLSFCIVVKMAMELEDEDERKQDFLTQISTAVITMSFPPLTSRKQQMCSVG